MLVTVEELSKTSLYPEIIGAITRGKSEAAEMQILSAESLVRSYMSRYDLDAIFGTATQAPSYTGAEVELVKKMIKIIASYYLVRMSNPNINIELFRLDYQDALEWLQMLQKGGVSPNLPYRVDNPTTDANEGLGVVDWASNKQRGNHF